MADRRIFEDREQFLEELRRLVREGVPGERIRVITPFGVPEVEEILPGKRSKVRFFALYLLFVKNLPVLSISEIKEHL